MYKIIGADGKEYGPIPTDTLKRWIAEGRANADTKVLADGATEWTTVAQVSELTQSNPPSAAPIPPSSPTPSLPTYPGSSGAKKTNPLALTGMILGIVSMSVGLCCCYGVPFNIAGIVCSVIALGQIKKSPETSTGRGMAIAGLVLSILSILIGILLFIIGMTLDPAKIQKMLEELQHRN